MAARQNQSYLIWIIVLVILSLLLALVAFLGVQKALEFADSNRQNEVKLAEANGLVQANVIQGQILRSLIGNMGDSVSELQANRDALDAEAGRLTDRTAINAVIEKVNDAVKVYEKDMTLLISAGDAANKPQPTYTELVNSYATALTRKHNEYNTILNDLARVQREAQAEIDAKEQTVQQTQEQLAKAQGDFESEKTGRQEDVNRLQTSITEMTSANNSKNSEFEQTRVQFEQTSADSARQIADLSENNDALKQKVNIYEKENFDLADGMVVRVAGGLNKVFINLGADDGLRPNRTFAVYAQGITSFQKNAHKAMIEVTRILGPHSAEARITAEQLTNPILNGDPIVSAVWDPGNSVHVALGGMFDLDYDGFDDTDKLIRMIENNGGLVVASHDQQGKVNGEMDPATRYFVIGDAQPPGADFNAEVARAAREMQAAAEKLSIEIIDTRKLLNLMGQHAQPVVERLDGEIGQAFRRRQLAEELREEDRLNRQANEEGNDGGDQ